MSFVDIVVPAETDSNCQHRGGIRRSSSQPNLDVPAPLLGRQLGLQGRRGRSCRSLVSQQPQQPQPQQQPQTLFSYRPPLSVDTSGELPPPALVVTTTSTKKKDKAKTKRRATLFRASKCAGSEVPPPPPPRRRSLPAATAAFVATPSPSLPHLSSAMFTASIGGSSINNSGSGSISGVSGAADDAVAAGNPSCIDTGKNIGSRSSNNSNSSRRSYALYGKVHHVGGSTSRNKSSSSNDDNDSHKTASTEEVMSSGSSSAGGDGSGSEEKRRRQQQQRKTGKPSSERSSSIGSSTSSRERYLSSQRRRTEFSRLAKQTRQFQKAVTDLEGILEGCGEAESPESAWRARILIRSARDADAELETGLRAYEQTIGLNNNNNNNNNSSSSIGSSKNANVKEDNQQHQAEIRAAQSACMKLHRDFNRIRKTLTMALSLYEKRQRAEVSRLGSCTAMAPVPLVACTVTGGGPATKNQLPGTGGSLVDSVDQTFSNASEEDYFDRALREAELEEINQKMHKVNAIYKDLAELVEDQQKNIDYVQENAEEAKYHVEQAAYEITCFRGREELCGGLEDVQVRLHDDDPSPSFDEREHLKLPNFVPASARNLAASILPSRSVLMDVVPFADAVCDNYSAVNDRTVTIDPQEDGAVEVECAEDFQIKKDNDEPSLLAGIVEDMECPTDAVDGLSQSFRDLKKFGAQVVSRASAAAEENRRHLEWNSRGGSSGKGNGNGKGSGKSPVAAIMSILTSPCQALSAAPSSKSAYPY